MTSADVNTITPSSVDIMTASAEPTTMAPSFTASSSTGLTSQTSNSTVSLTSDVNTNTTFQISTSTNSISTVTTSDSSTTIGAIVEPNLDVAVASLTMFLSFEKPFDSQLENPNSQLFITTRTSMTQVLTEQYLNVTGFRGVNITGFKNGSTVVDYTVKINANTIKNDANNVLNAVETATQNLNNTQTPLGGVKNIRLSLNAFRKATANLNYNDPCNPMYSNQCRRNYNCVDKKCRSLCQPGVCENGGSCLILDQKKSFCACVDEWAYIYSGDLCEEKKVSWQLVAAIAGGIGLAVFILFLAMISYFFYYQQKRSKYGTPAEDSYPLQMKNPRHKYFNGDSERMYHAYDNMGMYENYNTNMEIPNQWSDNHMMAHPNQMHWREFTPEANNAPLEYKTNFDHIDPSKDYSIARPKISARPFSLEEKPKTISSSQENL